VIWSDYLATNPLSGRTYRVALRGWERGRAYCECPDFRKNTLGTCKHVLRVVDWAKRRFPKGADAAPYERRDIAVHLKYGEKIELRAAAPPDLPATVRRTIAPYLGSPIEDVAGLVQAVKKIEMLGPPSPAVKIYPDAEEYIQRRLFEAGLGSLAAEIRRDPAGHPLRTSLLKRELLPYQLDGIGFALGAGRAILADDMGLGKTIQGIGLAEILAREAGIAKVLVVCPASLKAHWMGEIKACAGPGLNPGLNPGPNPDRSCRLVFGNARERAAQYAGETFFTVCNYEQVLRDARAIERVKWDLIILDEGQRIKNWEAKTSRTIKSLRSPFALVLSGTPLENRLEDLYSIVEFIDDRRLGPAFRFFNRHRVVDAKGKVLGYKNLDALRENLRPVLLRRTRKSVHKELPPRTTEIRRIPPAPAQFEINMEQKRKI